MEKIFQTTHLVKAEDINNHDTLYAGRMAEWVVESAYIASAQTVGDKGQMVCVNLNNIRFIKPVLLGDILTLQGQVLKLGRTSLTVEIKAFVGNAVCLEGEGVFVCVDHEGKKVAHGIQKEK